MDTYLPNERRQFARYEVSLSAVMRSAATDGGIPAVSHDISSSGVGLVVDSPLTIGQVIDLKFVIPDNGEELCVQGTVVWLRLVARNKYWAGVLFDKEDFKPIPVVLRSITARTSKLNA